MLDTSPAISSSAEGATVLTYAFPSLKGWKCVGYYYALTDQEDNDVFLDGTRRDDSIWDGEYFGDICIYEAVAEGAEDITLTYTGITPLSYVEFFYVMAPADQKPAASLSFENVFDGEDGDHGADEWRSSAKTMVENRMPNATSVYTGESWSIPAIEPFNTGAHPYEYWTVTSTTVFADNTPLEMSEDRTVTIPDGTNAVTVTYYWQLLAVTNVIEPLERVVKQGENELTARTGVKPDTFIVAGKENVEVDYTAKMDMRKLDSGHAGAASWKTLQDQYYIITDGTVVYLTFTFDKNIDLKNANFSNATLTSDMFTFTPGGNNENIAVDADAHTVKLTCHWDSAKAATSVAENKAAKEDYKLNPIITLTNVPLTIENDWTGDSVRITNQGDVTGYVHTTMEDGGLYGGIYGGYQTDTFVLTTQATLSYDPNSGEGSMESQTYTVGDTATVEANGFTRSGYTFTGWNTKGDGTGTAYKAGDTFAMPANDVVLYAQWSKNSSGGGSHSGGGGGGSTVLNTDDHYSYIIGYKDGTLQPYGTITRGEVATIFFRLLTDEARDKYWSQTNDYSDCNSELWCNNAISTLSNMGIIDGYTDGTFRPYGKITRAQFAKIAVGFFETTREEYQGYYSDVPENAWFTDYVEAASRVGLIQGFEDGTFRPNTNITRAQACVIVNRALNRKPDEDHLLPEKQMVTWPDNNPGDWYYADMQEATNSHDYTWLSKGSEKKYMEDWTKKLEQRDWAAFEHAWSTAHSAPGGEVVK